MHQLMEPKRGRFFLIQFYNPYDTRLKRGILYHICAEDIHVERLFVELLMITALISRWFLLVFWDSDLHESP